MIKKKKILLAAGCSFTDKTYGPWPMWPEIMSNELDLNCINLGKSAAGSEFILHSLIKSIIKYKDNIDTVAILWSGSDREKFYNHHSIPLYGFDQDMRGNLKSYQHTSGLHKVNKCIWEHLEHGSSLYREMIQNQLIRMCIIVDICKRYDIKLIMNQALDYFPLHTLNNLIKNEYLPNTKLISINDVIKFFTGNDMFNELDKNKNIIIGWPFIKEIGGTSFDDRRRDIKSAFISDADPHPSAYGQTLLAKEFLEKYNDVYSI